MFTVTPKSAIEEAVACIEAGLVAMFHGSPGVGKSAMAKQIAKMGNLKLVDVRLSTMTPEDLQGYPMRNGNKATFTPFDLFPLEGEPLPEGYDGWLVFFDELTSTGKPTQAAAYKIILDRMVGSFHLHPAAAMMAAGNKATDKAVVNQMSTALQSRLIHFDMDVSVPEWTEYAFRNNLDPRIIGFVNYLPSRLMDFRPDHQDKTFACPRTWEFLSRLVKGKEITERLGARVAGTIGQGVAVEFISFAKEYERLPKYKDIITDPMGVPVPSEGSTKYATMSMLVDNFDDADLSKVITYVERFDIEMQIIFCRGAVAKKPHVRSATNFAAFLRKMVKYLQ